MTDANPPNLGSQPNLNKPPLRTGNPPDTQADREDVIFAPPTWAVDRLSAGVIMVILLTVIVATGAAAVIFLFGVRFW